MEDKHPIEQYFSFKHPLTEYLPMEYVGLADGVLTMNIDVPDHFVADPATGAVHSGFATLVLDTVLGGAVLGHIMLSQPIATVGLTMFPFILPSSTAPDSSLTVCDSSSSHLTLFVMLVMAVIFVPIILAYTSWVYAVLWGKVTEAEVTENSDSVY